MIKTENSRKDKKERDINGKSGFSPFPKWMRHIKKAAVGSFQMVLPIKSLIILSIALRAPTQTTIHNINLCITHHAACKLYMLVVEKRSSFPCNNDNTNNPFYTGGYYMSYMNFMLAGNEVLHCPKMFVRYKF